MGCRALVAQQSSGGMGAVPVPPLWRFDLEGISMAHCFYCCHCGRCGPGSEGGGKLNPPGFCVFCNHQNSADSELCEMCGHKLPMPAGQSLRSLEAESALEYHPPELRNDSSVADILLSEPD